MADHPYKITEVFIKEEREDITDSPPRLTDDKQDSGIYKNRSGKPLNRGQKIMAFNVFKSHFNKGTNKSQSVKFTASQIGISERSVWSIVKEHETTGDLSSPSNKRPRPQADEKLNEEQKSTLRLIVHSFFLKNEPPTLNKLLEVVRLDDTIPTIGRTTLWKLLKKLGFKYEKRGIHALLI